MAIYAALVAEYRTTAVATRLCWRGNMKLNNPLMKSKGTLAIVQSIYDYVHLALWATLAAFVVFFLAFIVEGGLNRVPLPELPPAPGPRKDPNLAGIT